MRVIRLLILALFVGPIPFAQGQEVSDLDKFELWNDCAGVRLSVSANATELNRKEDIKIAVRSRLRAARIYTEKWYYPNGNTVPYLSFGVNAFKAAFSIDVALYKQVSDPASGETNFAATWERGSTGTHGNDSNYIISIVSQYTDEFIDEYLRVNASACR